MPPPTSALHTAGIDVHHLSQIVKLDIAASNELQLRIDQARRDIGDERASDKSGIESMEKINKDMTKDLVERIERIENQGHLTKTDREVIRALGAQLTVCDRQGMQLAELKGLELELQQTRKRASLQNPPWPHPYRQNPAAAMYTPENSPPNGVGVLPPPYTATNPQLSKPTSFTPPFPQHSRTDTPSQDRKDRQDQRRNDQMHLHSPSFRPHSPSVQFNFAPPPSPPDRERCGRPPFAHAGSSSFNTSAPHSASKPSSPYRAGARFSSPPSAQRRRDSAKAGAGEYQYYSYADYSDSEPDFDAEVHAEWSKTCWPKLYRILDIDPSTDPDVLLLVAKRRLERLSPKHNPGRVPNDPAALARWNAIKKAYDVLTHPERKMYYDTYGTEPEEVEGINIGELTFD
jgi:hypothetical protein